MVKADDLFLLKRRSFINQFCCHRLQYFNFTQSSFRVTPWNQNSYLDFINELLLVQRYHERWLLWLSQGNFVMFFILLTIDGWSVLLSPYDTIIKVTPSMGFKIKLAYYKFTNISRLISKLSFEFVTRLTKGCHPNLCCHAA